MRAVLPDAFTDAFARHGDRLAVTDAGGSLGYAELADRARAAANRLARYNVRDEPLRVGLYATNSADYVVGYLATLFAGAVPFLTDSAFGSFELVRIAEDCGLDLLLHAPSADVRAVVDEALTDDGEFGALAVSRVRRFDASRPQLLDDTEACRFTSGSTGRPNCIEFSGAAVFAAAANWAKGTGLSADDRIACFAALSNGLAFNTSLLAAFLPGASLHLSHGLPTASRVVRLLESTAATRLVAFPALYESIVRRAPKEGFAAVRTAISSGAPLRETVREEFTALTGVPIHNYYGIAETGPLTYAANGAGSGLGAPLPGVRLLAEEQGIRVKSESMGSRYLNAPGVFEERVDDAGYYHTGDQGRLLDGTLHLTGRTSRLVNVGGRKIDPIEIADVLRAASGVLDAAAFEAENQHGEPTLAAVVAVEPGVTAQSLRTHCAATLPSFKVPGILRLVDHIPANSIGKPSIERLRRLLSEPQSN
ncbi:class I adenylate-forming enzyme family protein [Streptomyces zagrosensis]|uniref:Acyl-CoA synthetase (AMP-forming)/AMP-acid ligase II n=1 Tax=Streptomyces zagrosensis TaxID=1042984 RepID=A0A7W9QCG3_9ACTN|nr:class I adenylate-forming enzyme family protein [Streptomyces zagrosensis]MBB5936457.1 acyl-CoA synthetase (AMP-forming)/AMP-acid ligase II [Streptomyces zagrosensis]